MLYGTLVGDSVMLTDAAHGKRIIELEETEAPSGYHNEGKWTDTGTAIVHSYALVPDEGTATDAALALSRLQWQSLPYAVAYQLRALAPRYQAGQTYAAGTRFLDQGNLYVMDEDFSAPDGARPDSGDVPCTRLADPADVGEWAQPADKHTYGKGSMASHGGAVYVSVKNNNTDEPGTSDKWRVVG